MVCFFFLFFYHIKFRFSHQLSFVSLILCLLVYKAFYTLYIHYEASLRTDSGGGGGGKEKEEEWTGEGRRGQNEGGEGKNW